MCVTSVNVITDKPEGGVEILKTPDDIITRIVIDDNNFGGKAAAAERIQ
jgi:hypothetical protein